MPRRREIHSHRISGNESCTAAESAAGVNVVSSVAAESVGRGRAEQDASTVTPKTISRNVLQYGSAGV